MKFESGKNFSQYVMQLNLRSIFLFTILATPIRDEMKKENSISKSAIPQFYRNFYTHIGQYHLPFGDVVIPTQG